MYANDSSTVSREARIPCEGASSKTGGRLCAKLQVLNRLNIPVVHLWRYLCVHKSSLSWTTIFPLSGVDFKGKFGRDLIGFYGQTTFLDSNLSAMPLMVTPLLLSFMSSSSSNSGDGLPNLAPFALALAKPALTLSRIKFASNSAIADVMVNIALPMGEDVSIFSMNDIKSMPR